MKLRVRVSNHKQFGRLARRLRAAADGSMGRELGQGLQRAAPPVLAGVQARVLGASFPARPSASGGRSRSTGFRAALAGATTIEPLASPPGVRFTVDGAAVGRGSARAGHRLALYTEGVAGNRWRHQVFGRTENAQDWVNQTPDPWFFPSFPGEEPRFARVVEQIMDKTARRILG